eukprot:scaffold88315_cov23-Tisochrysis_lutea.AAC.1
MPQTNAQLVNSNSKGELACGSPPTLGSSPSSSYPWMKDSYNSSLKSGTTQGSSSPTSNSFLNPVASELLRTRLSERDAERVLRSCVCLQASVTEKGCSAGVLEGEASEECLERSRSFKLLMLMTVMMMVTITTTWSSCCICACTTRTRRSVAGKVSVKVCQSLHPLNVSGARLFPLRGIFPLISFHETLNHNLRVGVGRLCWRWQTLSRLPVQRQHMGK